MSGGEERIYSSEEDVSYDYLLILKIPRSFNRNPWCSFAFICLKVMSLEMQIVLLVYNLLNILDKVTADEYKISVRSGKISIRFDIK